jgi:general L-amino acid transport system permease protein
MATMASGRRPPKARIRLSLNDPTIRSIIAQVVVVALVGTGVWYLVSTTAENLSRRGIASGFGYLFDHSEVPIGEAMIAYTPGTSLYWEALVVGLLNTLRVAVVGIVLATILGTIIGIARLSRNFLIAKLSSGYVEVMRNIPLLLQLLFWYTLLQSLPGVRQSLNPVPGVYLSNRGLYYPWIEWAPELWWGLGAFALGIVGTFVVRGWARERQARTGAQFPVFWAGVALIVVAPLIIGRLAFGSGALPISVPELRGFNFQGGALLTPEFVALLIGLVTYTAGFTAEIVRSGILAVSKGQTEAASALGLKRGQSLRLVILPQAMRVIIPPMTSQYLNVTKNSSLAVAIGYSDLVSVANTILNKNGQAIEGIATIMAAYLTVSLSISAFMNWYNRRIALKER